MATRTVTFTIRKPDGSAWVNARVSFVLSPGSFDDEASYLGGTVTAYTDDDGEGSVALWANADGHEASTYTVTLPTGETDTFILETGVGSIDLTELRT